MLKQVGVVDQEPVLFAGSIADNIRYGVPSATSAEVEEAARQVPTVVLLYGRLSTIDYRTLHAAVDNLI